MSDISQAAARYASGYGAKARAYAAVLDPTLREIHHRVVELAGCRAGSLVLDVATGTGAIARAAATMGAHVTAVDISTEMIAMARSMGGDIRYRVADVTSLDFEDGQFDCVTCGFAFSHLPRIDTALAELKRVLKPQGVLCESSWGAAAHCPAFSAVLTTLEKYAGSSIHAFAGVLDEDTWADPSTGSRLLQSAGFTDIAATQYRTLGNYSDPEEAIAWVHAWPDYGLTIDNLSEDDRRQFRAEALCAVSRAGDLSYWFEINYYTMKNPA